MRRSRLAAQVLFFYSHWAMHSRHLYSRFHKCALLPQQSSGRPVQRAEPMHKRCTRRARPLRARRLRCFRVVRRGASRARAALRVRERSAAKSRPPPPRALSFVCRMCTAIGAAALQAAP
eukprot:6184066-Pleurochrysis_carterae.AAC.5